MNQYRCETCTKGSCHFHPNNNYWKGPQPHLIFLHESLELLGCASHSDFQSERNTCPQNKIWQHCPAAEQIRKNARDTVLDEVITNIEFNGLKDQEEIWRIVEDLRKKTFDELERRFDYSDNTQFGCKKIRKILKELRQAGRL
jgi:hypothetical protein